MVAGEERDRGDRDRALELSDTAVMPLIRMRIYPSLFVHDLHDSCLLLPFWRDMISGGESRIWDLNPAFSLTIYVTFEEIDWGDL